MASRIFAIASSRVFPCEMQPGKAGHSATNTPPSSGSTVMRNFTSQVYQSLERFATGKACVVSKQVVDFHAVDPFSDAFTWSQHGDKRTLRVAGYQLIQPLLQLSAMERLGRATWPEWPRGQRSSVAGAAE